MREDEMEDAQDLDPSTEVAGLRLLAAAFETMPDDGASSGLAHEELLRHVRRRATRRRRVHTLVPAGAVAALGGATALAVTLTASVAGAPSALAAVTAAAAKTSAQSFLFTSTVTQVNTLGSDDNGAPVRITGVFDLGRGLGEEETMDAMLRIRIVTGRIYIELAGSKFAFARERLSHGKPWIASLLPPPFAPGTSLDITQGVNGDEPTDPGALLGLLKSAASVRAAGPASGPGWAGTKYAFTEPSLKGAAVPMTVSGTVYVDNQGRVRQLVTTQTRPIWSTLGVKGSATDTWDVTFAEFGARVSVTPPPASQVYELSQQYLHVDDLGGLAISGPRR
jgi:hypothetical protein